MAHHLVVAAHPNVSAAKIILEPSVNPFGGGAFVVADLLGQPVSGPSPPSWSPAGLPPDCRGVEQRECKQTTDRDATVGYIQMQLIAGPTRLVAFGIALAADRAMPAQVGQHPGQVHARLAFQAANLPGPLFSLAGATAFAFLLLGLCRLQRLLPRLNRCGIAGDVSDQAVLMGPLD